MTVTYESIGTIHTPFRTGKGIPIQPPGAEGVKGSISIKKKYVKGLKDLDGFSHIILIYHLHKSKDYALEVMPFLENRFHGVYATRAPKRPNPIGLSVVNLIRIKQNIVEIQNVDMLNGTPLLDIKPFIPDFDCPSVSKTGWIQNISHKARTSRSDNRFDR